MMFAANPTLLLYADGRNTPTVGVCAAVKAATRPMKLMYSSMVL